MPWTAKALPSLTKERREIVLPRLAKSRTLNEEPRRDIL
jgi:hypothetical protein